MSQPIGIACYDPTEGTWMVQLPNGLIRDFTELNGPEGLLGYVNRRNQCSKINPAAKASAP